MRIDRKSSLWGNIYIVLILRLLLVFGLYTITRLLFYAFNQSLFADIDPKYMLELLWLGLKYDASAIAYTNLLVIFMHIVPFRFRYNRLYQRATSIVFYIVNAIGITLNMIDVVYYRFTLRRTTTGVFQEFENENATSFMHFIWQYWYVSFIIEGLVVLMIWINKRIKIQRPSLKLNNYLYVSLGVVLMAIIDYVTVGAMRGGYITGVQPISVVSAGVHVRKPEHRSIVLNTPFALIRSVGENTLTRKEYFSINELQEAFDPLQKTKIDSTSLFNKFAGRNVVVIIWESLHREWIGVLNKDIEGYNGYTPFIDTLSTQSYMFARAYANGRKSIDAPPAIFSGIPSSETSFVLSHYTSNNVNSLASILKKREYYTAFYHGAANGSMRINTFINQAEFDDYFGLDEYDNKDDHDGHWGIWDEEYLQYTVRELNKLSQPFMTSVFTLSSHDPFKLPDEYIGKFPKGHLPIHQSIGYTDYALHRFFETASQQDWFNNTLFVITADHSIDGWLPEYKTGESAFAIPILFYAPGSDLVGLNDSTVVQHADIMPTVLSMLGVEEEFVAFGNNMFDTSAPHFAFNYFNGAYQLIEDEWLLQFTNEKTSGFYNVVKDRLMQHNLVGKHLKIESTMEHRIKSLIQQYNNRMIDNELVVIKD